jgi:NAD(P)-dependent dehydrogenase (short-subunit alcohol dehydrogenase family)
MDGKKRILLFGATGGTGEVVGDKLLAAGHEVYATCRTEAQREKLRAGKQFKQVMLLDLASMASIEKLFSDLAGSGVTSIDALINCAAINPATPMETVSQDETQKVFQVCLFGPLRAVQLAVPLLRPTQGRIILVGSLAGSYVMPMLGIYSSAKFGLEGACDALRRELYPWGIKVSLVKPGAILTAMFFGHLDDVRQKAANATGLEKLYIPLMNAHLREIPKTQSIAVSTDEVANDCMHALNSAKPRARYFSGRHSKLTGLFVRLVSDNVQDWLAKRIFRLE